MKILHLFFIQILGIILHILRTEGNVGTVCNHDNRRHGSRQNVKNRWKINNLIENQENFQIPSKGRPFGKIKGPSSKNDKIAIIGAGPAGVHMAYKLKDMGFKHVTVFESSGRIGGKSYTVYHRNVPHEMGTCYTSNDYEEVYKLIDKFDAGGLISMPEFILWTKENETYHQNTFTSFILKTVYEVKGISDPAAASVYFRGAVGRYVVLHTSLFGTYNGTLMPKPSDDTMRNITCSFLDLLKRHDLEVLKAIFIPANTVQGYGYLDEIPALYGLMWNTPNLLTGLITSTPENRVTKILEKGYQFLWKEIERQNNLDIRYYHDVTKIRRYQKRNSCKHAIDIYYRKFNCKNRRERFDFLIITPTMKTMLNKMDSRRKEVEVFSQTHQDYFTTTLLDTDYGANRPASPSNFFVTDVNSKINNLGGWALRDSYASLSNITGMAYKNGDLPGGPDGKLIQTSVFYQMSTVKQRSSTIFRKLARYIQRVLKMNIIGKPVEQITWPYFSRYSKEDLAAGVLWDIYDLQGKYSTWYAGASVSFESVISVVNYNLLLLQNYDVPA